MLEIKNNSQSIPVIMKTAKDFFPLFSVLLRINDNNFNLHLKNIVSITNKIFDLFNLEDLSIKQRDYNESLIMTEVIRMYSEALEKGIEINQDFEVFLINYINETSKIIVPVPETVFDNFPEDIEMALTRTYVYSEMLKALTYKEFTSKDVNAVFMKSKEELAEHLTNLVLKESDKLFSEHPEFSNILTKKSIIKNQITVTMVSCIDVSVRYAKRMADITREVFSKERKEHTKNSLFYLQKYEEAKEKGLYPPFVQMIEQNFPIQVMRNYEKVCNLLETKQMTENKEAALTM